MVFVSSIKTLLDLCKLIGRSQKCLLAVLVAQICLVGLPTKTLAQDHTNYNIPLLENSIDITKVLLPPFGKMQTRIWHIDKKKITAGLAVPFDESQLDFMIFPQNPQILPEAPPEYLVNLVYRLETLLFAKTGVITFALTQNTTSAFLKEKTIALGKDMITIEAGHKNEKQNLSFVVAHEFAHLIIFNEEIRTGTTPSGYISATRELGDASFSQSEYRKYIRTVAFPKEAALAHAEVDMLACLLLKRLGEIVPASPIERAMNDARAKKQTTRSLEDEYTERTKALRFCRELKD